MDLPTVLYILHNSIQQCMNEELTQHVCVYGAVYHVVCIGYVCKQIDREPLRSSINYQLIAGRFGHRGLRLLHAKLSLVACVYTCKWTRVSGWCWLLGIGFDIHCMYSPYVFWVI